MAAKLLVDVKNAKNQIAIKQLIDVKHGKKKMARIRCFDGCQKKLLSNS